MVAPTVPASGDLRAILINNNADRTNDSVVDLILSADGATEMMLSNSSTFSGSIWETYVTAKSWTLLDEAIGPSFGDGTKTIYIKFRSVTLEESNVHTASIYLDTTPPIVGSMPIVINQGDLITNSRQVSLTLSAIGATSVVLFNETDQLLLAGTEMNYSDNIQWTLSEGNGSKTVFVNFLDDVGNETGYFSESIRLVEQDLQNPVIIEPIDSTTTTDHFVTVRGTGDPQSEIKINIEGN